MTEHLQKDLFDAAALKKGCTIADRLNLLTLTERVNALDALQAASKGAPTPVDATHRTTPSRVKPMNLLELRFGWGNTLYRETYSLWTNSSTIDCNDYDSSNAVTTSKTFEHKY